MKTIALLVTLFIGSQCNAQRSDFVSINFKKADSIALAYKGENLKNLPELSFKLTSHLTTDVEKFRAIYKWVCDNIANDYKLYLKNEHKRQRFKDDSLKLENWNYEFKKLSFEKLLKKNRTICTGYAYLVKELASLANLTCEIVQGYGRTSMTNVDQLKLPNHSWNAVLLNEKWYLCDATWASGIPNPETNLFQFHYNDGFFFPTPELFAINHFPVENKWFLLEEKAQPTFEKFLEAPILYNEAYTYLNTHLEPKKLYTVVNKMETIRFSYQLVNSIDIQQLHFLIDSGSGGKKTILKNVSIEGKLLTIDYSFEKKGFYDVHFMIGPHLISTYTFDVKK